MIVSDSTTLIVLYELKRFELLLNLFNKIYIPKTVFDEINYKKDVILPEFIITKKVDDRQKTEELKMILDEGESEAIVLALQMELPLIIDEKKGRKIAKNLGLKIVGLLGIVLLNIKKGFISQEEAKDFLDKAIQEGFRINPKLIKELFAL